MYKPGKISGWILILFLTSLFSQEKTIKGFVHDYTDNPVENVSVTLIGKDVSDTTDENGHFVLAFATVKAHSKLPVPCNNIYVRDNVLHLDLSSTATVQTASYSVTGKLLYTHARKSFPEGKHHFPAHSQQVASQVSVIQVLINNVSFTFKCLKLNNRGISSQPEIEHLYRSSSNQDSFIDSIVCSHERYFTEKTYLETYPDSITIKLTEIPAGIWTEVLEFNPPVFLVELEVTFNLQENKSYTLTSQKEDTIIYLEKGTWKLDAESLVFTGTECSKIDTTVNPDTLTPCDCPPDETIPLLVDNEKRLRIKGVDIQERFKNFGAVDPASQYWDMIMVLIYLFDKVGP